MSGMMLNKYTLLLGTMTFDGDEQVVIHELDDIFRFPSEWEAEECGEHHLRENHCDSYLIVEVFPGAIKYKGRK